MQKFNFLTSGALLVTQSPLTIFDVTQFKEGPGTSELLITVRVVSDNLGCTVGMEHEITGLEIVGNDLALESIEGESKIKIGAIRLALHRAGSYNESSGGDCVFNFAGTHIPILGIKELHRTLILEV